MIVPTAIPFSAIPAGGVFTNGTQYLLKNADGTTATDLASGANTGAVNPSNPYPYFAGATLLL